MYGGAIGLWKFTLKAMAMGVYPNPDDQWVVPATFMLTFTCTSI